MWEAVEATYDDGVHSPGGGSVRVRVCFSLCHNLIIIALSFQRFVRVA